MEEVVGMFSKEVSLESRYGEKVLSLVNEKGVRVLDVEFLIQEGERLLI